MRLCHAELLLLLRHPVGLQPSHHQQQGHELVAVLLLLVLLLLFALLQQEPVQLLCALQEVLLVLQA